MNIKNNLLSKLLFFLFPKFLSDDPIEGPVTKIISTADIRRCYYCGGSGFIEDNPIENKMLSKSKTGNFNNSLLSECPSCNGSGFQY